MSKIEKALKIVKKKEDRIQTSKLAEGNKVDNVSPKAVSKDDNIIDYLSINNPIIEPYKNPNKHDSHIASAIKKKVEETTSKYEISTEHDSHEPHAEDNFNIIPSIEEINGGALAREERCPSTKVDGYNVDERLVAYYDSIGKQTWEGPVMVHFRRLQLSLSKFLNGNMSKVIAFTSATQSEGKSIVALNTAITLCNDNKSKVVFVNCDFRKQVANSLLGFNPDKGLVDYLAGETEIKKISFNGLVRNLVVIPAGKKPPNTYELLASGEMKQFISYLRGRFDYVVIDTPPVLTFPDTTVLASLSDGVVFVINSKKTKKAIVKRAVDTLHDCKILGCVMNKGEIHMDEYYDYKN
jgi:capsular exopolysaccharide synthesis family protein